MSTLLIRLNGAPDDEIEELRTLLTDHAIDFYETDAGRWGFSVAGFWLRDKAQLEEARALIDHYQRQRAEQARSAHAQKRSAGQQETLLTRLAADPLRTLLYLLLIGAVLYLSLLPFLGGL